MSLLRGGYILSLRSFLTLSYLHGNFLAFSQGFAAGAVNCTVVNKNIFATFLFNKSKTFFIIEPLNGTPETRHLLSSERLATGRVAGGLNLRKPCVVQVSIVRC